MHNKLKKQREHQNNTSDYTNDKQMAAHLHKMGLRDEFGQNLPFQNVDLQNFNLQCYDGTMTPTKLGLGYKF